MKKRASFIMVLPATLALSCGVHTEPSDKPGAVTPTTTTGAVVLELTPESAPTSAPASAPVLPPTLPVEPPVMVMPTANPPAIIYKNPPPIKPPVIHKNPPALKPGEDTANPF